MVLVLVAPVLVAPVLVAAVLVAAVLVAAVLVAAVLVAAVLVAAVLVEVVPAPELFAGTPDEALRVLATGRCRFVLTLFIIFISAVSDIRAIGQKKENFNRDRTELSAIKSSFHRGVGRHVDKILSQIEAAGHLTSRVCAVDKQK